VNVGRSVETYYYTFISEPKSAWLALKPCGLGLSMSTAVVRQQRYAQRVSLIDRRARAPQVAQHCRGGCRVRWQPCLLRGDGTKRSFKLHGQAEKLLTATRRQQLEVLASIVLDIKRSVPENRLRWPQPRPPRAKPTAA